MDDDDYDDFLNRGMKKKKTKPIRHKDDDEVIDAVEDENYKNILRKLQKPALEDYRDIIITELFPPEDDKKKKMKLKSN